MPNADDDTLASWGGGQDLSAWEALMWRTGGDYRTRSTGVMVELLDSPEHERREPAVLYPGRAAAIHCLA